MKIQLNLTKLLSACYLQGFVPNEVLSLSSSSTKYDARDGCRYINNCIVSQTDSCNNVDIITAKGGQRNEIRGSCGRKMREDFTKQVTFEL